MHALAGDGDGGLDEKEVVEAAARRLRAQGVTPEPALALLEKALVGQGAASGSLLVAQLESAIGARHRPGTRWIRAALSRLKQSRGSRPGGPADGPGARSHARVVALVGTLVIGLLLLGTGAAGWIDLNPSSDTTLPPGPSDSTPADHPTPTASVPVPTTVAPPGPGDLGPDDLAKPPVVDDGPGPGTTAPPTTAAPPPTVPPAILPPVTSPPVPAEPAAGQWRPTLTSETVNHCMTTQQAGPNLWYQICWVGATPMMIVHVSGVTGTSPTHQVSVPRVWTVVNGVHSRGTSCPLRTVRVGERFACVDETGPSAPGANIESHGRLAHDGVESILFTPRI
jgi:hypothetical protein